MCSRLPENVKLLKSGWIVVNGFGNRMVVLLVRDLCLELGFGWRISDEKVLAGITLNGFSQVNCFQKMAFFMGHLNFDIFQGQWCGIGSWVGSLAHDRISVPFAGEVHLLKASVASTT